MTAAPLILRADANGQIGSGHVMRCLALAHAWQASEGRAKFVSCCPVEKLRGRIKAAGAELFAVERPHPDPADLATTLDLLEKARSKNRPSALVWVVLDGYHFDSACQQAIRTAGGRLLVIDDVAHLGHYHADVLLNQNFAAEQLNYACDAETTLLLGCRYAVLRPEFQPWRAFRRETPKIARKLLVMTGGADPDNVTQTIVRALGLLDVPGLQAKVVVGPANPHPLLKTLQRQLQGNAANVQLLTDVTDMPELMARADVALSAAGSTCWELALMQLPAVVFVLADNQRRVAQRLAEAGVVSNLGRSAQLTAERIVEVLSALCRHRSRRISQSMAGRRLVDGCGVQRVLEAIRAPDGSLPADQVRLRPVAVL